MENSLSYKLGMLTGFLTAFITIFLIRWYITKRKGRKYYEYDERQILARGKAYKIGFYTLLIYLILLCFAQEFSKIIFLNLPGIWFGICLTIVVFASVCIVKDAYMAILEQPKEILMALGMIGVINVMIGIKRLMEQPFIVKGVLQESSINLMAGLVCIIVFFVLVGRLVYLRYFVNED